jgi:ATP-dependent DNA ligase
MMKMKPAHKGVAVVIGYEEERTIYKTPKQSLGAFHCRLESGITFRVGTGLTQQQRQDYWDTKNALFGKIIHYLYGGVSTYGTPFFTRFVKLQDPL